MKIYVVVHATYENANVFFSSKEAALARIKEEVVKDEESDPEDWSIIELEEGEVFTADFVSCV